MYLAFSKRDQFIFLLLSIVAVGAFLFWLTASYLALTRPVPEHGGQYIEGMIAQPRYINPILSQTSDADADLVELLYVGLFRYGLTSQLEKQVASDMVITDEGRTYTVTLRSGVRFHDGVEMTADDVVFTVRAIQDPAYKSPLRANWLGVEANATDRFTVVFTLKKAYFGFVENLTVGILPRHIWESIAPESFTLADYNLSQPIGAGPYQYQDIEKDSLGNILAVRLRANSEYFAGTPYIDQITFRFYSSEDSLFEAYERKEVMGMRSIRPSRAAEIVADPGTHVAAFPLPRLFAVFFNTNKSVALAYDEVREALSLATNRDPIVEQVLLGYGVATTGPFLPFIQGTPVPVAGFDIERANALLDEKGWKRGNDGIRGKNDTVLTFELTVPDWPELMQTADLLRDQWQPLGARVEVKVLPQSELQQKMIRPREYQALLFGQGSMLDPDPYSFWHSSQKGDPGQNLAFYDNKEVDTLLTTARETLESEKRREAFVKFQTIINSEHPAVFLYSPSYLYVVNELVRGIEVHPINTPSARLSDITHWYIKTKRVRK